MVGGSPTQTGRGWRRRASLNPHLLRISRQSVQADVPRLFSQRCAEKRGLAGLKQFSGHRRCLRRTAPSTVLAQPGPCTFSWAQQRLHKLLVRSRSRWDRRRQGQIVESNQVGGTARCQRKACRPSHAFAHSSASYHEPSTPQHPSKYLLCPHAVGTLAPRGRTPHPPSGSWPPTLAPAPPLWPLAWARPPPGAAPALPPPPPPGAILLRHHGVPAGRQARAHAEGDAQAAGQPALRRLRHPGAWAAPRKPALLPIATGAAFFSYSGPGIGRFPSLKCPLWAAQRSRAPRNRPKSPPRPPPPPQGPQYVVTDFNIFVCTVCSGVQCVVGLVVRVPSRVPNGRPPARLHRHPRPCFPPSLLPQPPVQP